MKIKIIGGMGFEQFEKDVNNFLEKNKVIHPIQYVALPMMVQNKLGSPQPAVINYAFIQYEELCEDEKKN